MTNVTILTTERPTEGQFVTVYKFAGDVWSRTFRHTVEGIEAYELHKTDTWSPIGMTVEEMFEEVEVLGYLGLEA